MNTTFIAVLTFAALAFTATQASAVSRAVKMACANDYFSYCSAQAPGSPGVNSCFRANGSKLSHRCVGALVKAGLVSKTEVRRRAAKLRR